MSEVIGNRYQITKLIGKGGMAEVYLAWDSILNREVAVKVLKSDMSDDDIALERFKREAGSSTQLSHPNIVDVYDVGDDGDKHYIVMEYVKGYTLKQLIKKRGAIPYKEAVWMMKQLAGALMEAHRKGIIHRDVKSQNVLIKPDGTIKLSDFGIALANGSMQITSKDSVLGSVHYLAPELSRGKQASMQSDIYSLGIVFYELLTGDVPFKAETPIQVALMHVRGSIPSVKKFNPSIPQSVENILIKATAKSLSNRYKNIALMIQDLNECLKPEHANDIKIELDDLKETGVKQTMQAADEEFKKLDKQKRKVPPALIVLFSLVCIIAIVVILFLSGVFSFKHKTVLIPNIENLTLVEAKDILTKENLNIDESNIEYRLSDHIEKDRIISVNPSIGSEVELNYRVKVVISKGISSILDSYIGKNYLEAEKDLKSKNFLVSFKTVQDSSKQTGTIVEQSMEPGKEYDSSINNPITLTYVLGEELFIDPSIKNMKIEDAYSYFSELNVNYELIELDISSFNEEELKDTKPYTIIKTVPDIGSSITLSEDTKVVGYYYSQGDTQ